MDCGSGMNYIRDPKKNKDICFSQQERQQFALTGLLPPCGGDSHDVDYSFLETVCLRRLQLFNSNFDRYDWLMHLFDKNIELFYRLFVKNTEMIMPLIYTPTVGEACQKQGLVYSIGRGLFITVNDNIEQVLENWPEKDIRAICVTDGERILGLGDLGAFGMGIPVGKLALYTGLAGISPSQLLPITLDVGTNNQSLIEEPTYFGKREKRLTGPKYFEFLERFMTACTNVYGKNVLIQFEDFGNNNAFALLSKYQPDYCCFNDDIQGTASVVLAAIMAAMRATGRSLCDEVIVCLGAGEAALGLARLLVHALADEAKLKNPAVNCEELKEKAKKNLYLIDSRGLMVKGRAAGNLTHEKLEFSRPEGSPELKTLTEIVEATKCTTLLGAAALPKAFTPEVLKLMAKNSDKPVIMALSNPTHKAECTAEEAYTHTQGKCIFASGSPFGTIKIDAANCADGVSITRNPSQANNSYIFPALGVAILAGKIKPVTDDDFLVAATTLSNQLDDFSDGSLFPPLKSIRQVSSNIARAVMLAASAAGRCHADGEVNKSNVDELMRPFSSYPTSLGYMG